MTKIVHMLNAYTTKRRQNNIVVDEEGGREKNYSVKKPLRGDKDSSTENVENERMVKVSKVNEKKEREYSRENEEN